MAEFGSPLPHVSCDTEAARTREDLCAKNSKPNDSNGSMFECGKDFKIDNQINDEENKTVDDEIKIIMSSISYESGSHKVRPMTFPKNESDTATSSSSDKNGIINGDVKEEHILQSGSSDLHSLSPDSTYDVRNNANLASGMAHLPALDQTFKRDLDDGFDGRLVVPRDVMLKLTDNINSGLLHINDAFELIKHSQAELLRAKHIIENVYATQNGAFGVRANSESSCEDKGHSDDSSHRLLSSADNHSVKTMMSLQEDLPKSSVDDIATEFPTLFPTENIQDQNQDLTQIREKIPESVLAAKEFRVIRGRGGRMRTSRCSRGSRRGGFQSQNTVIEDIFVTSYNSEIAQKGLQNLLRLNSSLKENYPNIDSITKQVAVVLHDLTSIIGNQDETYFSASQVESKLRVKMGRIAKMKKKTSPEPSGKSLEEQLGPRPQQSTSSQSSETNVLGKTRNHDGEAGTPVTTPTTCKGSDRLQAKKRTGKRPNPAKWWKEGKPVWKQLRVEPEVMERIFRRIKGQEVKSDLTACESQSSSTEANLPSVSKFSFSPKPDCPPMDCESASANDEIPTTYQVELRDVTFDIAIDEVQSGSNDKIDAIPNPKTTFALAADKRKYPTDDDIFQDEYVSRKRPNRKAELVSHEKLEEIKIRDCGESIDNEVDDSEFLESKCGTDESTDCSSDDEDLFYPVEKTTSSKCK